MSDDAKIPSALTLGGCWAGDYNRRSLAVLKPNGYIAHILAQGWSKTHGDYLGNVYEVSAIAKGCALAAHGRSFCHGKA